MLRTRFLRQSTSRFALVQKAWFHNTPLCMKTIHFKLADIGEGISEVEVLEWFVKPGDHVEQFAPICSVQSDKAKVDITSRYDGRIKSLSWNVGDLAKVGSTLVELEVDGEDNDDEEKPSTGAASKEEEEEEEEEQQQPQQAAEKDTEKHGSEEKKEKPKLEITRPPSVLRRAGSFSVDPVLLPKDSEHAKPVHPLPNYDTEKVLATPSVRRLCRDHDIDITMIQGTGKGGRVLKEDVLQYIAQYPLAERRRQVEEFRSAKRQHHQTKLEGVGTPTGSESVVSAEQQQEGAPEEVQIKVEKLINDVVVPVRGIQRLMVKSMQESLSIPHFNFMEEYEMNEMVEFRNHLKKSAEQRQIKLSYMPILIKAASLSLIKFPQLNAHVNSDCSEVVQKASHNIGVAMDTPRGLLVPVVKDVQEKSILDVAADLTKLQALGGDNKLGEEELKGVTFTLSNIGAIGGTYASPIIPSPTVAIGAIGKIQTVPKFKDIGNVDAGIYAARIMNISWAADHRVVDGATMARFSNQLKTYIENPLSIIGDLS